MSLFTSSQARLSEEDSPGATGFIDKAMTIASRFAVLTENIGTDEMTRHSLVMVSFVFMANLFNYLYQLSMGILLTPERYGIVFSLNSLILIIMVFSQSATVITAKSTSKLKAEGRFTGVNYLWRSSLRSGLFIGLSLFVVLGAMSPLISSFLNLGNASYPLIIFAAIPLILPVSVNWCTLQGLQRFLHFVSSQALAGFLRLASGIILVYLGLGVYGSLAALPISFAVVLFVTLYNLRDLPRFGNDRVAVAGLRSFAGPSVLAIFSIWTLVNIDAVLARHYLNATDAGNYSVISVLGRVAFYAPIGVAAAMFPKTSELFESGGNHGRLFAEGILLTVLITGGIVLIFGAFSHQIIQFLFGSGKYPMAAPWVLEYAIAMALFATSYLLVNYFLSINQTKVAYPLLVTMVAQIALIGCFHSGVEQIVHDVLIGGVVCIVSLIGFALIVWRQTSREQQLQGD